MMIIKSREQNAYFVRMVLLFVSTLILSLALDINVVYANGAPNAESDFVVRYINGQGGVAIEQYRGSRSDVVIPDTFDGLPVLEIGPNVFADFNLPRVDTITSIHIPDTVKRIKWYAFFEADITEIRLPPNLTEVDEAVFALSSLTHITIPNGVTRIGKESFYGVPLESVTLPDSIATIEDGAFMNTALKHVTIPGQVTEWGQYIFSESASLTTATIEQGVKVIPEGMFDQTALNRVNLPNTLEVIEPYAFRSTRLERVVIPTSTRVVHALAFENSPLKRIIHAGSVLSLVADSFPNPSTGAVLYGNEGGTLYHHASDYGYVFKPLSDLLLHESRLETTILSGEFSLTAPSVTGFGDITLSTQKETLHASLSDAFTIVDARGSFDGYRVDVSATPLQVKEPVGGYVIEPHRLPAGSLVLNEPATWSSGLTSAMTGKRALDAGSFTVVYAPAGSGMGVQSFGFDPNAIEFTVDPSSMLVDTIHYPDSGTPYETTITWSLIQAP